MFFDTDHVIRLGRSLLAWETDQDRHYASEFFEPEVVGREDLAAVGQALRNAYRLDVAPLADSAAIAGASAIVFRRGRLDASLIAAAPRLRLIQRVGASPHMIDLESARSRGIFVSCLPRRTLAHVAEHVLLLMLSLSRNLLASDRAVRNSVGPSGEAGGVAYNWASVPDISLLAGKTLGIIGFGEIGHLLARRASAFEMKVVFTDSETISGDRLPASDIRQLGLEDLLRASDFVSVHVPPLPNGRPLIGAAQLRLMRHGANFLNAARGSLVDEDALYEALASGRLGGAGLDVHAREPRGRGDRFATLQNVVLTPHLAGGSRKGVLDEIAAVYENILDVLAGEPPRHARAA
ncbi:NAD(P)-dependent oxidoreductase [Bradyrhizobium sp. Arg314]